MENKLMGTAPVESDSSAPVRRELAEMKENVQILSSRAPAANSLPVLTLSDDLPKAEASNQVRSVVVVDKSSHRTHILQMHHGRLVDVLNVPDATGKGPKLTPEGRFQIINKEKNPTWYPPESVGGGPVPPGPNNPMGVAKIRTNALGGRILLHGTNRPDQIGTNASLGCIRHHNQDILKIYPLVNPGDAVYITRNFKGTQIRSEDFSPKR